MKLGKLEERDFEALRGPFKSGRQSPSSMGGMLILAIFLQGLMFFLTYVVGGYGSFYPKKEIIFTIHLVITVILIVLSIIYGIPSVYMKHQKTQYLLTIVVSQNLFGMYAYIGALFIIGSDRVGNSPTESLLNPTIVTLLAGILVFVITCIRFYILLHRGKYRKGSKKDKLRGKFEAKSFIPMAVVGGMGLVYIIQYIAKNSYTFDVNVLVISLLGPILFFAMLFVLPEQLVILYCKYRFDSFNFSENGNLKPLGTDRKDA